MAALVVASVLLDAVVVGAVVDIAAAASFVGAFGPFLLGQPALMLKVAVVEDPVVGDLSSYWGP